MNEEKKENQREQIKDSHGKPNTSDLEERARSLIQEIYATSEMLELLGDTGLGQRISSLCHELSGVRDLLFQAMSAMESNATRLEEQKLNSTEEELKLKRAAEVAWAEVNRLGQIIEEIDSVLAKIDESMHDREKAQELEWLMLQNNHLEEMESNKTLADFDPSGQLHLTQDSANNTLGKYDFDDQSFPLGSTFKTPLLGGAPSSNLKDTLAKISKLPPIEAKTQTDLNKEGYYGGNAPSGPKDMSQNPYRPLAFSPTKSLKNYKPIVGRAGFDGSYSSTKYPGASAIRPTFSWKKSGKSDDTKP